MRLRPAGGDDAAQLAPLRADRPLQHLLMASPDPGLPADPLADARAWIARREAAGWFRVIEEAGTAEGFVQVAGIHRRNRFGWFGMALLPRARGRGLGAAALAATEAAASAELRMRKLLLEVRADNAVALALYVRAGWRRVGYLAAHYDDGDALHDVVLFEKMLPRNGAGP